MRAIRLPIKKYQSIAGTAAVIGFLLGVLIPAFGFGTGRWSCPFGAGVFRVGGFVLLTGIVFAALIGNLTALLLIFVVKQRRSADDA